MHNEMKGYNEEGIAIRYMLYPRAGVDSPSYDKAVNVWCAENQKEAMTKSKNGKEVKSKTCENPIKEHMAIANEIGVNGTPAIVLDDGHLIPGYRPPKDLAKVLEQLSAK
jgi:thiol:disulfide interchange protein DsbC